MTLGIALFAKEDTIILISDKRVTEGSYAMSAHGDMVQKIHKVSNKCGLTIAGDAGAATAIIEIFLKELELEIKRKNTKILPVTEVAEIFRRVAVEYYTKWYKDMSMQEWVSNVKNDVIPFFRVLMAGFDNDEKGKPSDRKIVEMSSLRRFSPIICTVNFSTIGITTIAQYLLYRFYKEEEENVVAGLGAFCITETNSQDDGVGDEFHIASFSKKHSFKFYTDDEVNKIKNRCFELKTELQTSLYTTPKVKEEK
ncbi:MAG: hypothetical protein US54_C0039G0010 [Candidatus Roizmanbacteria bacterium GW2011_GWA2_37_7]|uniref:Proteasome subunit beta n=1 Tax=Candidatus Roizmanbacteria bacterium GW2011_GWA2_37_7 TaxID=1618481 RepID=A0A0G0JKL4_9BACT|nr:MAG: hypothetical protein US54_C0039G0010 [Candidatus Roizmanbacteria bacterium GW2011_GWA2_37_7]